MTKQKMDKLGIKLLDALEEYIHTECNEDPEDYGAAPSNWEKWPLLYSAYGGDRDGCVRESGVFGNVACLESEIINMFGAYFRAIRDFILEEMKKPLSECWIDVMVEPSYEDRSKVMVTYKNTVLCGLDTKAWNFCWDSPQEMAESMIDDYKSMKDRLQKALAGGELKKAYVVISVYKGIIQGDDGVHVTFSKDKADELTTAADKEMGIERGADGRYDSDNDVYCLETDIVW